MNQRSRARAGAKGSKPKQSAKDIWQKGLKQFVRCWPYFRPTRHLVFVAAIMIPVIAGLQALLPALMRYVIDKGISAADAGVVIAGSGWFFAAIAAEYLARASQAYVASKSINHMTYGMRSALIRHVMALSPSFHDQHLSGSLVTRCTSDFDSLNESLSDGLLNASVDIAILVGAIIGLIILSTDIAWRFLLVLPVLWFIVQWFSAQLKATLLHGREKVAILNGFASESLFGLLTIKNLSAERFASERFDIYARDYRRAQIKRVVLEALMFSVIDGLATISIGLTFWLVFIGDSNLITAGVLVGGVQYMQKTFEPLKRLSNKIAILQGAFAAFERIFELFDKQHFIEGDSPAPQKPYDITCKDLRFCYREGSEQILKGVDWHLPFGRSCAIVGATGSGKSTLIKVITRMYSGYEGSIDVGGVELSAIEPMGFRQKLSIVPQDIVLFSGTLERNISLGRSGISTEDCLQAAHTVGLAEFISSLPDGLDTPVLEDGKNLSYGQKQLLIFARAIATDPDILVLDEATATIDPETEALIQKALVTISAARTTIIIAHRLQTIKNCDQIIYLKDGIVVEQGNHDQLMSRQGHYAKLHASGERSPQEALAAAGQLTEPK